MHRKAHRIVDHFWLFRYDPYQSIVVSRPDQVELAGAFLFGRNLVMKSAVPVAKRWGLSIVL
jgi:hypothetical protein